MEIIVALVLWVIPATLALMFVQNSSKLRKQEEGWDDSGMLEVWDKVLG